MKYEVVNAFASQILPKIDQCLHLADSLKTQTLCSLDVSNRTLIRVSDFGYPDPTVKWCRRCRQKFAKIENMQFAAAMVAEGMSQFDAGREVGVSESQVWRLLRDAGEMA